MKNIPLYNLPPRDKDTRSILSWSARSPNSKTMFVAIRTTEQQIIDAKTNVLPKIVVVSGIAGGAATYQLHGAVSSMAIFKMLGISSLLTMSALQLALLVSGGILVFGSLGIVIWRAGRMYTEDQRVARGWRDLDNFEQMTATNCAATSTAVTGNGKVPDFFF